MHLHKYHYDTTWGALFEAKYQFCSVITGHLDKVVSGVTRPNLLGIKT